MGLAGKRLVKVMEMFVTKISMNRHKTKAKSTTASRQPITEPIIGNYCHIPIAMHRNAVEMAKYHPVSI